MRAHPTGGQATRYTTQRPVSTGWTTLSFAYRLLLATSCSLAAATSLSEAEVWVVTDRLHPVKASADVRLINLDAPARIEADLAARLSPDPKQASAIVQQRLKNGGADLHRRFAAAYSGVTDAWSLGIVKLPAIIVDRQYVVYGEPDVERAVARIKEYRSAHP